MPTLQQSIQLIDQAKLDTTAVTGNISSPASQDLIATVNALGQSLDEALRMSQELPTLLVDFETRAGEALDRLRGKLNAEGQAVAGKLGDSLETGAEKWRETFANLEASLDELVEQATVFTETVWQEGVVNELDATSEALESRLEDMKDALDAKIGEAREALEAALAKLDDQVTNDMKEAVSSSFDDALSGAVEELKTEIGHTLVSAQLQAQVSAALSPILPQLLTVRVVAGSVRRGLEILRMGV